MFCPKCGTENADDAAFCGNCGVSLATNDAPKSVSVPVMVADGEMTFGKAITTCLGKYVDFSGRAARPEYWWFYLFTVLLSWGALLVDGSGIISNIISLGFLLPSLSAGARRLHDTGRSGWWLLISLTIIGIIPLIIWLASKGDDQANEYGNPV